MIGLVIVAHSHELAVGVRDLALQMCPDRKIKIKAAGGSEDGSLGTSYEKIQMAVQQVWSKDGVLILMDLGSSVMTTQMVVEMMEPEQQKMIRISGAPLVEGAIAAAATASGGGSLDQVQHAADRALADVPKLGFEEPEPEKSVQRPEQDPPDASADLLLSNPTGLHARPAMDFAKTASRFASDIRVRNLTRNRDPVDAKMPMQMAFGGTARKGETIRIFAKGPDADQAVAALETLVNSGFGETGDTLSPSPSISKTGMDEKEKEIQVVPKTLHGIGVCEGFAVGPALMAAPLKVEASLKARTPGTVEEEKSLLHGAIREALDQIRRIQSQTEAKTNRFVSRIFEFQQMMLEDPHVVAQMEKEIQDGPKTAEKAVRKVFGQWEAKAENLDGFMKERVADLEDVEKRLTDILGHSHQLEIKALHPCIVVAEEITPSQVVKLDRSKVMGIATALGGAGSHGAILARSLGIPTVMGLGRAVLSIAPDTRVALDGETGLLEVNPSNGRADHFEEKACDFKRFRDNARAGALHPAVTLDGKTIHVAANAENLETVKEALSAGASGIGLLRTEFLYLNRTAAPDEEEQFSVYGDIVRAMGEKPVVMRTLDAGGDKPLPFLNLDSEANPQLGVRGLRLSLDQPEIFHVQLRAMLRAAALGNLKIMFPMVADAREVAKAKTALDRARESLVKDGVKHGDRVEVGIMVEIPSAALAANALADEVDFFSIGTNDLTQYTLACDRGNPRLDHLYDPFHPAVLELIQRVIRAARDRGIKVGLCGEMAGLQKAIPLLLKMGLDEFSVSPARVPFVKQWIRRVDTTLCGKSARKILKQGKRPETDGDG